MVTNRKSSFSFRGKVSKTVQKSTRVSRSYLTLPEGTKQFVIDEGAKKIQLDFLPYIVTDSHHPDLDEKEGVALEGNPWFRRPFKVHRNIGTDNETCVCPKSIGKPCPICKHQQELFDKNTEDDKEMAISLYAKDRVLYVVSPLNSKKFDAEPHVWDMAQSLFQDTLKETLDEDDSHEIFPDLKEGETLELSLKWKKLGKNTFPETTHITFLERDPYPNSTLETVPNLDEVLKVLSYKELEAKFFEVDAEEDGGELKEDENEPVRKRKVVKPETDDEDERPTHRRSIERGTPGTKRRPVVEEDDEPVRRPARKLPSADDEDKECPYGHRFGRDNDKFDECDDCSLFNNCYDEKNNK